MESRGGSPTALVVSAVLAALMVAGCGSDGTAGSEASASGAGASAITDVPRTSPAQSSGCLADAGVRDSGATALGRVHFFAGGRAWQQGDELQVGSDEGGERFSKQAIAIRGHDLVVLRVPRGSRRSVDLAGWGTNDAKDAADTIRIYLNKDGVCTERQWAAYPGGFNFTRKQCLRLRVEADGGTKKVPFGLGRPC